MILSLRYYYSLASHYDSLTTTAPRKWKVRISDGKLCMALSSQFVRHDLLKTMPTLCGLQQLVLCCIVGLGQLFFRGLSTYELGARLQPVKPHHLLFFPIIDPPQ